MEMDGAGLNIIRILMDSPALIYLVKYQTYCLLQLNKIEKACTGIHAGAGFLG